MRRRDFIKIVAGSAVAWPHAASAQGERTRHIGVLMNLSETDSEGQARIAAFREGLNKLGWLEGRNIQIEYRWAAGNPERLRAFAAELVALKPEAIFAAPTESAAALQRETRTVPIVFAQAGDPVASGLVASVPRPGGNITGFALYEFAIAAQWVELLKQIAPNITRVAVMYYPATPGVTGYLPMIEAAARIHAVEISSYPVRDDAEVEQAIETFAREPNGGLIPLPSTLIATHREFIISLATRQRLPNVFAYRYYPANGGVASYGADNIDGYRRAADYVDRILKGEKPADLPVQFPTKYQLVINRQGPWIDHCTLTARHRRRSDRITTFFIAVRNVRFWHKADIADAVSHVRFLGSGHHQPAIRCLLLTQRRHRPANFAAAQCVARVRIKYSNFAKVVLGQR